MGLHYVAKTKALISFAVIAKLICVFVFAYAKRWFSHDAAQIFFFCNTSRFIALISMSIVLGRGIKDASLQAFSDMMCHFQLFLTYLIILFVYELCFA